MAGRHPARQPRTDAPHPMLETVALAQFGPHVLHQKIKVLGVVRPQRIPLKINLQPHGQVKKWVKRHAENQVLATHQHGIQLLVEAALCAHCPHTRNLEFQVLEIARLHHRFSGAAGTNHQYVVDKLVKVSVVSVFGTMFHSTPDVGHEINGKVSDHIGRQIALPPICEGERGPRREGNDDTRPALGIMQQRERNQ